MPLKKTLKTLENELSGQEDCVLLYFDESRFGTHSKIGRSWRIKGKRSPVKVKLGYDNFYLYSSVEPKTGEHFTLIMPHCDTDCFNVYLQHLAQHYQGKQIYIIMDQAGWHKAKGVKKNPDIHFIFLPPYSPELNPVEKFWQYIKDKILKNKVYQSLEQIQDAICFFFQNCISRETIKSITQFSS